MKSIIKRFVSGDSQGGKDVDFRMDTMEKQANETVVVLDFGGQYSHLIARRVRECGVYCEVRPHATEAGALVAEGVKGVILTGGPNSVYDPASPRCDPALFACGLPVLGICYGAQLMAWTLGGRVEKAPRGEYGGAELLLGEQPGALLRGLPHASTCWMSHTDYIAAPPEGFTVTASTADCPCAAMEDGARCLYAVQLHPEVAHTRYGREMLENFLKGICGCAGDWQMRGYIECTVAQLKERIGGRKVLCAMSGGVDSTVAAALVHRAAGDNLTCIFIDHGLLRKGEGDAVEAMCRDRFSMRLIRVDARDRFLSRLRGLTDPEDKRKAIGEEFIRAFEEESRRLGRVGFLVQGTIYPDVIESGLGGSAVIKSHHNVGGLPEAVDFDEILEPLRPLFKDEVRHVGIELGIPETLVWRQPFPGPGLAVRVLGEVTAERLEVLRQADAIFREEIARAGLQRELSQYFAVLTDLRSVGVMGDGRTYCHTVALRAVTTSDFMTADFARLPWDVVAAASSRIVNEVPGINRVVYDVTAKPPATIEWE